MSDHFLFSGDLYCPENYCQFTLGPKATDIFADAKYHCTNFEAPLPYQTRSKSVKSGPALQQSESVLDVLDLVNATHLCLANNHIFDNGCDTFIETQKRLKGYSTLGAGVTTDDIFKPSIIDINGEQIALLNACERQFGCYPYYPATAGYAHFLDQRFFDMISFCSRQYSKTIIIAHGGLEMVDIPLPQVRNLYRSCIDAGASAVIGHHPHVIQNKEMYKNSWIYYSIGNFLFRSSHESNGCLLKASIDLRGDIEFTEFNVTVNSKEVEIDQTSLKDDTKYFNSSTYQDDYKSVCDEYFDTHLKKYFNEVTFGLQNINTRKRLIQFAKLIFKSIIGYSSSISRTALLYHLIAFDTNRWTIEIALENKIFGKKNLKVKCDEKYY